MKRLKAVKSCSTDAYIESITIEAHPVFSEMDNCGSFQGVKLPMREADQSPSFSTEVKNGGIIGLPPIPHTLSWYSAQLIKHRNKFIPF
jgi:hypothetical protein